jgi:hypothetical protein
MLKHKIIYLHKQGYKKITIVKKLNASTSHVYETLSKKKCVKKPHRITSNEYKHILKIRNGKR